MNIKQTAILSVFCISALMWSASSSASSILGIYAGASVGKGEITNTNPKLDSTTSKVYAGYRILGPLAIEVARVDLGEYGTLPTKITGTSADAVLYLPAGLVNVFAKAGVFNWKVDYNGFLPAESGVSAKYGFGAEYNLLLNVDLRLEMEKYSSVGDGAVSAAGTSLKDDITVFSLGVNIAF